MAKMNQKNGGRPSKHMGEKGLAKVSKSGMLAHKKTARIINASRILSFLFMAIISFT